MQVSLETTSGLERRLTVGIPAADIDSEVEKRLREASKNIRINGFRKGKVPIKVVKQRYGAGVRQEVLGDAINRYFQQAIAQESVRPAGQPTIEPKQMAAGKDVEFTATFEVYPEIELKIPEDAEITRYEADINDADLDRMIEVLREGQAQWQTVERAAQDGDQTNINFVGRKDGEEFDGGKADNHTLVLGSNTMIPGFEVGIVGMAIGEEKVLPLSFPEDYQVEDLKGAAVEFTITLNSVSEKVLPELDEEFFTKFGVNEGGEEKFREDVLSNMERERDRAAKNKIKTQIMDALLEANDISVPSALIESEINVLRQQMLQQYGKMAENLDVKTLLPDDMFRQEAERRTALGLLVSEVITQGKLEVDKDRVREMIEELASTYEDSQEVINYYYSNEELLSNIQAGALEAQAIDYVEEKMQVTSKQVSYEELVNNQ